MIELTGIASLLRGASILYWLLAVVVLVFVAWKVRNWGYKAIGIVAVLSVFGFQPIQDWKEAQKREAFAREAWAYFKKKCDTESGEKIYKTFTDVRSVLVVKPLPPSTDNDHFDQYWYGDPYSGPATENRAESAARRLAGDSRRPSSAYQRGLDFVEMRNPPSNGYVRIHRAPSNDKRSRREDVPAPISRFGVSWEDISTPEDRKFWVAGSRLRVVDLADNSVVAERIGYLLEAGFGSKGGHRRPWLTARGPNTTCPPVIGDYSDQQFITNVFKQPVEK
jgi:type II secretory pathway pseudopilin PulG